MFIFHFLFTFYYIINRSGIKHVCYSVSESEPSAGLRTKTPDYTPPLELLSSLHPPPLHVSSSIIRHEHTPAGRWDQIQDQVLTNKVLGWLGGNWEVTAQ